MLEFSSYRVNHTLNHGVYVEAYGLKRYNNASHYVFANMPAFVEWQKNVTLVPFKDSTT
jgi:hypothetical protein